MEIVDKTLFSEDTPLVFADGTSVYEDLKKEYITHEKGYFIYGPSGVGKTYFINNQVVKDWIDGDLLWPKTHAFPNDDWWNRDVEEIDVIERRADVITEQAKKQGFWIIGASSVNIVPDAIVMPDLDTHIKYIKHREETNYDGGMTVNLLRELSLKEHIFLDLKKTVFPFLKVSMMLHII